MLGSSPKGLNISGASCENAFSKNGIFSISPVKHATYEEVDWALEQEHTSDCKWDVKVGSNPAKANLAQE